MSVSSKILKVQDKDVWYVESSSKTGKYYKVTFSSCECPDHQFRGSICQHMIAIMERAIA
jgi:hypothetical protein